MARLSFMLTGLLAMAAAAVAADDWEWDQEKMDRDSSCDNDCFFGSFPGGSCTDDPACMCNQDKYRERYFCCMAEKCDEPMVLWNSTARQFLGCEAHGVPIPEEFDPKEVCGISVPLPSVARTPDAPSSSASSGAAAATSASSVMSDDVSTSATASPSAAESSSASGSAPAGASASGAAEDEDDEDDDDEETETSFAATLSTSGLGLGALVAGFGFFLW